MKDFFGLIEYLFVEILFAPLDFLRSLELESWILANGINFVFIIIIASLLVYWMVQLVGFDKSGEDDKDPSAHSFLLVKPDVLSVIFVFKVNFRNCFVGF